MWKKRASSRWRTQPNPSPSTGEGAGGGEFPEGTITDLRVRARRGGDERLEVFLDDRYAFSVSAEAGLPLQVGHTLDRAAVDEVLARSHASRAHEAALRLLAFRPRSVAELRRRLAARGIPEGAVQAALERLALSGLVGDEAFARYWVEQRQTFRPRGPRALLAELRLKGVNPDAARAAVATVADSEDEAAYRAGLGRARRLHGVDRRRFDQTMAGHLARRGFGAGAIRQATRRLWTETHAEVDGTDGPTVGQEHRGYTTTEMGGRPGALT